MDDLDPLYRGLKVIKDDFGGGLQQRPFLMINPVEHLLQFIIALELVAVLYLYYFHEQTITEHLACQVHLQQGL